MIYIDIGIIFITIILFLLIKDILKFIRTISIITLLTGYLMIFLSFIIKIIIKRNISYIGIGKISNIVGKIIIDKGLSILTIGVLELVIYFIIYVYHNIKYLFS